MQAPSWCRRLMQSRGCQRRSTDTNVLTVALLLIATKPRAMCGSATYPMRSPSSRNLFFCSCHFLHSCDNAGLQPRGSNPQPAMRLMREEYAHRTLEPSSVAAPTPAELKLGSKARYISLYMKAGACSRRPGVFWSTRCIYECRWLQLCASWVHISAIFR